MALQTVKFHTSTDYRELAFGRAGALQPDRAVL